MARRDYQLRHVRMSTPPSVRPSVRTHAWNNSVQTRQIFMKFDSCVFRENLSRKFNFH